MDLTIPHSWHINLIGKLIPVSGIIYVILTLKEAAHFNKSIRDTYSNIDRINLNWLTYLVIWTAIIWVVVIVSYLLDFIFGDELQANLLIYITMSIFLYALGIKSLRQPQIVMLEDDGEKTSAVFSDNSVSYQKSGLSEELADSYLEKLLKIMSEEKPFRNNKLNLSDLSKMIGISNHNLSEVINKKLTSSFYDFINKYRVEEVKKLIEEDKDQAYSILAHGYEAGFSSKSAFYTSFKKVCGITPAQYRDELKAKRVA
jgi:AraC-like DNA-binding protein